jgi:hypothetical protein
MNKEEKIEYIRKACIEANPEIVELKFGCEVIIEDEPALIINTFTKGRWGYWEIQYQRDIMHERYKWKNSRLKGNYLRSEFTKIIGRPIRLSDVLVLVAHTVPAPKSEATLMNEKVMSNKFKLFDQRINGVVSRWEWKDDNLEHQTPETIDFIFNLLNQ